MQLFICLSKGRKLKKNVSQLPICLHVVPTFYLQTAELFCSLVCYIKSYQLCKIWILLWDDTGNWTLQKRSLKIPRWKVRELQCMMTEDRSPCRIRHPLFHVYFSMAPTLFQHYTWQKSKLLLSLWMQKRGFDTNCHTIVAQNGSYNTYKAQKYIFLVIFNEQLFLKIDQWKL